MIRPRYPIYVISKGRPDTCLTARFLARDGVDFRLVVEPHEADLYAARHGRDRLEILPFANLGQGSVPARNWVWEHSRAAGHAKHWILDDNIRILYRRYQGERIPCDAGPALSCVEDLADRYSNLAIAGLNYKMFATRYDSAPAFWANVHVYSCLLISNDLPFRWRGRYNEDADLTLQVLSAGLCTILVNAFLIDKIATMLMKGGNTDELYAGDGRLRMARSLEAMWPGVVQTKWRWGRPQHVIKDNWKGFDTPLRFKPGAEPPGTPDDEYGLELVAVKPVRSGRLRRLLGGLSGLDQDIAGGVDPGPDVGEVLAGLAGDDLDPGGEVGGPGDRAEPVGGELEGETGDHVVGDGLDDLTLDVGGHVHHRGR